MFDQCGTRSPSNPLFRKKMSVRAQQFWSPTHGRSVPVTAAVRVARSGGTTGLCVGHVAPEAADGGPIAFLRDGDQIRLDVAKNTLDVLVDPDEFASRREGFTPPRPRYTTGVLAKYVKLVGSAAIGAVCS